MKLFSILYKNIILRGLFYYNHRVYMKRYLKWLSKRGCHINGEPRYIGFHVKFDDYNLIEIGNDTTISDDCHLLTHDYSLTNVLRATNQFDESKGDMAIVRGIKIGENCFIGKKSILMPGCELGNHVVIGAGSVVRGHIPDRSVVMGNPSQIFSDVDILSQKWGGVKLTIKQDKSK